MITNSDITLYNYWYNADKKEWEYRATHVYDVYWHTSVKTVVTDKGVISGDIYNIRIPVTSRIEENRKFIESHKYKALPSVATASYWTVAKGDLFVKGIVFDKVNSLSDLKQYQDAGKIDNFSINLIGTQPHIRIGGVA